MKNGSKNINLIKRLIMPVPAKPLNGLFLLVMLAALMALPGCENDLNKVRQISKQEANNKIDSSKVVEIIYSDSARVKARVVSPLLLSYTGVNPYHLMPRGVKIYFFDGKQALSSTVVGDSAISKSNDKIIELHRNVVVSNVKGDVFKSDELIWDQLKKQLYSDKPWTLNKTDGTALSGVHFKSDESFSNYSGDNGAGVIVTNQSIGN